jgi:hypothetical protein
MLKSVKGNECHISLFLPKAKFTACEIDPAGQTPVILFADG